MNKTQTLNNREWTIEIEENGRFSKMRLWRTERKVKTKRERVRDFFRDLLPRGVFFDMIGIE